MDILLLSRSRRLVASLSLGLFSLVGLSCRDKVAVVGISESMRISGAENKTESAEYEATLEPKGKVPDGDSLYWTVKRTSPDGPAASIYEKAVMKVEQKMSIGFVRLPNSCLRFGDGISALREALIVDAVASLDLKPNETQFAQSLIGGYLRMDATISGLMAVAPMDLLGLSKMKAGFHDSMLMTHPQYAGIPIAYSIDFHEANGGLEGSARVDTSSYATVPVAFRSRLGHVGRFIRRKMDGSKMELTVVDTLIVPPGLFVNTEERRVQTRVFRTELPLR